MIIEIMKLLEMRGELEDIRTALTPDTLNGITEAQQAREYVFDVIDEMKKWEGEEVEPARITLACRKLDKASDFIGPYDSEIGNKILAVMSELEAIENNAAEEDRPEKEIYISHRIASLIYRALEYQAPEDEDREEQKEIAAELFKGNVGDAEDLVNLFRHEETRALLEEISYWDSPAEDLYHIWKYYDYCLPLLEEYAESTGYYLRWKAYNEEHNLPIPEEDRETEEYWNEKPEGSPEPTLSERIDYAIRDIEADINSFRKLAGKLGEMGNTNASKELFLTSGNLHYQTGELKDISKKVKALTEQEEIPFN